MRRERDTMTIHATAVAIDGVALVIRGPSGSGKSCLAARLVRDAPAGTGTRLVGDDRVVLFRRADGRLVVRPHPAIAGFIERRGLGLVAVPYQEEAPVAALADLGDVPERASETAVLQNLPALSLVNVSEVAQRSARIRAWWTDLAAAFGPQMARKTTLTGASRAKDYNCSNVRP